MEWQVVLVISTLLGMGAIVAKPLLSLARTIERLNILITEMKTQWERNRESADRIHQQLADDANEQRKTLEKHSVTLESHEYRIRSLEERK